MKCLNVSKYVVSVMSLIIIEERMSGMGTGRVGDSLRWGVVFIYALCVSYLIL